MITGRPYLIILVDRFHPFLVKSNFYSSPMSPDSNNLKAENTITDNVYKVYLWEVYIVLIY